MDTVTPNTIADPTVPTPEPVPPATKSNSLAIILSVLLLISLALTGFLFYQNQVLSNQIAQLQTSQIQATPPTTYTQPTQIPTATIDSTTNWKTYNSPEIGSSFSPFQLSYPPSWTIKEELTSAEPKSLTLTLTKTSGETIKILQGAGGGGSCIYYDDADYLTYEGMGRFFSSYIQISKPSLWRISKPKDQSDTSYAVCEKSKERYLDSTKIGWIEIKVKSEVTLQEVKSIFEKVVLKPSPQTKTLFD